MNITWIGTPNFTSGREGNIVQKIIIHWMDGNIASADATFQDVTRQTSAHYGIEDSTVHQYVHEEDTAWHSGDWQTNLTSIGIEHSAQPGRDASEATYQTSIALCSDICRRYQLNENDIYRHSDIIATECPGTIDIEQIKQGVKNTLQGDNEVTTQGLLESLYRSLLTHPGQPDRKLDSAAMSYIGAPFDVVYQAVVNSAEATQARNEWRAEYDRANVLAQQVKDLQAQLAHKPNKTVDATKLEEVKKTVDAVESDLRV